MKKADFQQKQFYKIAKDYIEKDFGEFPVLATWAGVHQYDEQMREVSLDKINKFKKRAKETLTRVKDFKVEKFDADAEIDWTVFCSSLKSEIRELEKIKHWQKDPGVYIREAINGIYFLVVHSPKNLEKVAQPILARLKKIPQFLLEAKEVVEDTPPVWVDIALDEVGGGKIFFNETVRSLIKSVPKLEKEVKAAYHEVKKSLDDYESFLKSLKKFKGDFSVGSKLFAKIVEENHFLPYSLSEIENIGWSQIKETKKELKNQAKEIDRNKTWQQILADFKKHHGFEKENLVNLYQRETEELKKYLVENQVVSFPQDEALEVVSTPDFMRCTTPTAAYQSPGPLEKDQKGVFYVSDPKPDLPWEQKDQILQEHAGLTLTCAHEAYPGHHLQLIVANRHPSLVRKLAHHVIFVEGWALYTEELIEEIGFIKDPALKLKRLADQLWRAYRIVIDIGLQTKKLKIAEAQRLLMENLSFSQQRAQREINWYTRRPGYPMCYLLGKLEIEKLRKKLKGYTLKKFHDQLLSCGSIPTALSKKIIKGNNDFCY